MTKKGRPRLPDDQKLSEVIPVRFTKSEADRIYSEALKEDGGSASKVIRRFLPPDFLYKKNEPAKPTT